MTIQTVYKAPSLFFTRTIKNGAEKYQEMTIHFVDDENEAKGFAKAISLSSRIYYDLEARNKLLQAHLK